MSIASAKVSLSAKFGVAVFKASILNSLGGVHTWYKCHPVFQCFHHSFQPNYSSFHTHGPHTFPSTTHSNPAPRLQPSSHSNTCMDHTNKWVINLSRTPSPRNSYLYYIKDLTLLSPPKTPHRSLHNSHRTRFLPTTSLGGGWVQIRC